MRMKLECTPCFIKQVLMEMNGSDMTPDQRSEAMRRALRLLSGMDHGLPPVGVSLLLHRELLEAGVSADPYLSLKEGSTLKAMEMLPDLEKMLDGTGDRLGLAAKMAIAGNVMDYGAANQLDLEKTLEAAVDRGLAVDDFRTFREELSDARKLSYYLDNSGEIVLDAIFMKEMIRSRPELRIEAFVKKAPMLNDVTMKDARLAGLHKVDGVEMKELEREGWPGPDDISADGSDIIIVKGQGNFESLSDVGGIYFLLVVKCDVVSRELGAGIGEMVFKKGG